MDFLLWSEQGQEECSILIIISNMFLLVRYAVWRNILLKIATSKYSLPAESLAKYLIQAFGSGTVLKIGVLLYQLEENRALECRLGKIEKTLSM